MHTPTHLYGRLRERLDAFARNLDGIDAGEVESLHHTRVASRRLRELLPLLELDREATRNLRRRLRKATKLLGTVRELDVEMLLIQELARDRRYAASALSQIGARSAQAHAAARKRLSAKLPAAKLKGLARSLERVAKALESADTNSDCRGASRRKRAWLWALEARLAKRAGRVRAAIEATGAVYVPERLHGVRIAAKKMRYAAELAADAPRQRITADIAVLKAAQDLLGRLHDFEMLLVRAREVQATLSPPDLRTWRDLGSLIHLVECECRQLHARYMRDRTDLLAVANRIGASTPAAQPVSRRTAS